MPRLVSPKQPALIPVTRSPRIGDGQSAGFFTTISANGTAIADHLAVSHPFSQGDPGIHLFAFDPEWEVA